MTTHKQTDQGGLADDTSPKAQSSQVDTFYLTHKLPGFEKGTVFKKNDTDLLSKWLVEVRGGAFAHVDRKDDVRLDNAERLGWLPRIIARNDMVATDQEATDD